MARPRIHANPTGSDSVGRREHLDRIRSLSHASHRLNRGLAEPTSEEIAEIVGRYAAGEAAAHLGREFRMTSVEVRKQVTIAGGELRSLSEAARRHALNEHAFDTLSEDAAYWIGFLMADGCIRTGGCTLTLSLGERDADHLAKFQNFLGSQHEIKHYPKKGMSGAHAKIVVTSRIMIDDLERYGVTAKKSQTARVSCDLELNRHFWRGAVDGDGWLGLGAGNQAALHMHGSLPLMEQFLAFVRSVCPTTAASVKGHKSIYRVALGGRAARAVTSALYEEASVALTRKAQTAAYALNATGKQTNILAVE